MKEKQAIGDRIPIRSRVKTLMGRRTFLSVGGGVTTTLIAGCTSGGQETTGLNDGSGESDKSGGSMDSESTDTEGEVSGRNFRLLISDLPADIGDFDRLDVTFQSARVFDGGGGEVTDESNDTDNSTDQEPLDDVDTNGDDSPETNGDELNDGDENTGAVPNDGVDRRRGFFILDLDGATVDLTQVVGEKAMSVFEGTLSEGTYNKIELYVSDVEGIVDGELAEVKVPSEKLQITHTFEVRADETVDFVFDINVVRRGRENRYNLTPVISGSGVNGEDVDVAVVENGGDLVEEGDNGTSESDPGSNEANGETPDPNGDDGADN